MRVFITFLLILFSLSAYSMPDQFNVYVPNSGVKNITCRAIFDMYGKKYNANPVYMTKEGAAGMLAMLAMTSEKKFSVLCSGVSESLFNNSAFPGHEAEHKLLTMVTLYATGPVTFYTGADSKFTGINDLLTLDRPVTIGYHTSMHEIIVGIMFEGRKVVLVPYKSPNDALPSLINGSLDMYTETGALEQMVTSGRLKSLGYINGNGNLYGADITKKFPRIAQMPMFLAITTSSNNDPKDIEELNHRLVEIVNSEEVSKVIKNIGWVPAGYSVKKSNELIDRALKEIETSKHVK